MHIEEKILELYVLGAQEAIAREEEITEHIRECDGCNALFLEMKEYYGAVETLRENFEQYKQTVRKRSGRNLLTSAQNILHGHNPMPLSFPKRIKHFYRRHPIASTVTSLFSLVGVFMMLNFYTKKANEVTDTNPAFPRINWTEGTIEIFNKNDEKIYQWVCDLVDSTVADHERKGHNIYHKICIADLNNDGRNEIVTSLLFSSVDAPVENNISYKLYTFASKKERFFPDIEISEKVHYKSALDTTERNYNDRFIFRDVNAFPIGINGEINIFSDAYSVGRSPSITTRINNNGTVIGQFWHFGNLELVDTIDFDSDGKKEILFCGENDVDDDSGSFKQYGILLALDPEKILGKKKSLCTPGFQDLEFSDAEKMYIKFPLTSMNEAFRGNSFTAAWQTEFSKNRDVQIGVISGPENYLNFFHYFLTKQLRVLEVKSNYTTNQVFAKLVDEGKLKGKIDKAYLEDLKNRVQYWDGEKWRNEWTVIKHKEQLAVSN